MEEEDYQKMCNQIFDKLRLLRDEGQSGLNSRCSTSNLATLLGVIDDTPRNKGPEGKVSNSNNSNRNAQQHRVVAGNHVPSEYNPNSNQNMQQKQQQLAQLQAQLGNNLKHKVTSPRQGK